VIVTLLLNRFHQTPTYSTSDQKTFRAGKLLVSQCFVVVLDTIPLTVPDDSGSAYRGSNPWGAANLFSLSCAVITFLLTCRFCPFLCPLAKGSEYELRRFTVQLCRGSVLREGDEHWKNREQ